MIRWLIVCSRPQKNKRPLSDLPIAILGGLQIYQRCLIALLSLFSVNSSGPTVLPILFLFLIHNAESTYSSQTQTVHLLLIIPYHL